MSDRRLRFPGGTLEGVGLEFLLLLWLLPVSGSCTETVNFLTYEEEAPGAVIGVLFDRVQFNSQNKVPSHFRLQKQFNSSLLRVREGDGQLTVGDAGLDREQLCGQAPQCVLAFDVVSFSQEQFRLVHVEVEVRDVNDHAPRFPRAQIPVEVSEGAAVGTRIPLEVPVDEDVGANGLQSVRLTEPNSPFRVELQTRADGAQCADLVLLQELDRESQDTYELDVRAQDRGAGPRASTCKVIVRIRDVNDNAPDISITPLAAPGAPAASPFAAAAAAAASLGGADAASSAGPGTPEAGATSLVPEGAARESLVALVSTSDRDSGANGQVRCALYGHEHFRLQPAYAGSYLVVTAASLDRERIAEYNLTLVAEDRGAPPLRTVRPYTVRVGDENDNAPLFTRPVYEVSVRENNPPGAYLATVVARDPDLGRNGQVTYRLLEAEVGRSGDAVSTYVSVDPVSGELRARRCFDREELAEVQLGLEALDGGSPPLRGRTLVRLQVEDLNDHAPRLVAPLLFSGSAQVLLPRGAPLGYLVTTLRAEDADEGSNAALTYTLLRSDGGPGGLALHPVTGELSLQRRLSPEPAGPLTAVIVVRDGGWPTMSCTATLLLVPADPAPPGGEVVLVPPPPPPLREPGDGPAVRLAEQAAERRQPDLSAVWVCVLASGCGLLLVAIVSVTCFGQGETRTRGKKLCERRPNGCQASAGQAAPSHRNSRADSEDFSSRFFLGSPLLCVSAELLEVESLEISQSGDSGVSLCPLAQERTGTPLAQGSISVPSHSPSSSREDKSAASLRTHPNPDEFSVKDSGKADSELNDRISAISREAFKKTSYQMTAKQVVSEYSKH